MTLCVCFQVGDRIVSINGQSVDGLSHSEAVSMLKNSYGNISLEVTHLMFVGFLCSVRREETFWILCVFAVRWSFKSELHSCQSSVPLLTNQNGEVGRSYGKNIWHVSIKAFRGEAEVEAH